MPFAQTDRFALATLLMAALLAATAAILLVVALVGIFRNRGLGPRARVAWGIAAIAIPIFGPIAYLLFAPRTAIRETGTEE